MKYIYYTIVLLFIACTNRIESSIEFQYMGFDNGKSIEINDTIKINNKDQRISIVECVQDANKREYLNDKKTNLIIHEQTYNGFIYYSKLQYRDAILSNGTGKWFIILERHRVKE